MSVTTIDRARRVLAIHESGHAVVGLALGVEVHSASISFASGVVRSNGPRREHRILIAAGPVAELRFAGMPPPTTLSGRPEWRTDAEMLRANIAEVFAPADQQAAYRCAIQCAEIVVRETWPAILRVADELLRCSFLDGAAVRSATPAFDRSRLPSDPHQLDDAAIDQAIDRQHERLLDLTIADQRRRMAHTAEPLLRAHNQRVAEFHQGLYPRARHLHGDRVMHSIFETSDIGKAGASMQASVITRARQVQAAVLAGRVARGSAAAEAARNAIDLAKRGALGAPLLAELERRMGVAA